MSARSVVAAVLVVLGVVLAPVSLLAVWTRDVVSDTDRFAETVAPLLREPTVRTAVAERVGDALVGVVDVRRLADEAVRALVGGGSTPRLAERLQSLTGPLVDAIDRSVRDRVAAVLAGPGAAGAWDQVVRTAHRQVVGVLSGRSQAVTVDGGTAVLDLAPLVDTAARQLGVDGFDIGREAPGLRTTIPLFDASVLERARTAYDLLDKVAAGLPWITVAALVGGVALARDRRTALLAVGLGVGIGMLLLWIGLGVLRGVVVAKVPDRSGAPAAAVFDVIVGSLGTGLLAALASGVVLAAGAVLAGRSRGTGSAPGAVRGG